MRLATFARTCAAVMLVGAAAPAFAAPEEHAPPPMRTGPPAAGAGYADRWDHPAAYRLEGPDGAARARWIDECADRIGGSNGREECDRYLHDYYASYMRAGPAYGAPAYGYAQGSGCCAAQPMRPPASGPKCTETVEVTYETVASAPPPRARPRPRPAPDKRIKVVPDKRIGS